MTSTTVKYSVGGFILTVLLIVDSRSEAACNCSSTDCPNLNRGNDGVCGQIYYTSLGHQSSYYSRTVAYSTVRYCRWIGLWGRCLIYGYRVTSSYSSTLLYTTHYTLTSGCKESCCSGHQSVNSSNAFTCIPVCSGGCANGGTCVDPEVCVCAPGWTGTSCEIAEPCPHLNAPLNGSISCTGEQVTDEMCSFSCDPGFELLGSSQRLCQPNNTWTGVDTYCNILHCPVLEPTEGSFIVDQCDTIYQSSCTVPCITGYFRHDSDQNLISCVVGNTSDSVQWTERSKCIETQPCAPNPCRHNGECSEEGDGYTCNCEGTGYTGELCQWGVVYMEHIPVLATRQTFCFNIRANPDMDLTIELSSSESLSYTPTIVVFNQGVKKHTVCISSVNEVITQLHFSLSGGDSRQFVIPKSITIVAQDANSTSTYAEVRAQPVGILEPSCCTDTSLNYFCPSDNYPVSFTSTCFYGASTSPILIPGISFVIGPELSLPLSLHACTLSPSYQVELQIDDPTQCQACSQITSSVTCSSSRSGGAGCYCYTLSSADTRVMFENEALAKSYFMQMNHLLPPWLNLQVVPTNRSHFEDSHHTFLASHNNLSNIQSCPYFIHNVATSGLHSILKYRGELNVGVNNDMKSYIPPEEGNLFCIAVDTCMGSNSPIHISLPSNHPFNGFLEKWKDHGWKANLRGFSIQVPGSFVGNTHYEFWNGSNSVGVGLTRPNIAVSGSLRGNWRILNMFNVSLTIDGEFLIEASDTHEIFGNGLSAGLNITSLGSTNLKIAINSASLTFSRLSTEGFFSVSDSVGKCNTTNIGLMRLYHKCSLEQDDFFSGLLPISSLYSTSCPIDIAFSLNSSSEVVGLALQSTCHELVFGELVFSGTDHIISIGGNLSPVTCASSFPTASVSTDMVIYTSMGNATTRLNIFISVAQPENNIPQIVTYVDPITETYTATVYNALISIWNTMIQSVVTITKEGLKFSVQEDLFQEVPVTITGTASTDHPWEGMELRIEGWIDKETVFVRTISSEVQRLLTEESNSAVNRINNAEASLNRLKAQKNATNVVYINAMFDVQEQLEKCSSIESDITMINHQISQLELQIAQSTSTTSLQQELENICQIHPCEDTSIPSLSCMWCTSVIQKTVQEKCLGLCSYNRTVRIQNGTMKVTELREEMKCSPNPYCLSCQHNQNNPTAFTAVSCIGGLFPARCTTYSVSYLKDVPSFATTIQQASHDCLRDCNTSLTFNYSHECCEENNEIYHFPQPNCVAHNTACRIVREEILNHLSSDVTFTSGVNTLRELGHAKANLTILKVELLRCNIRLEAALHSYNQTIRLYREISQAVVDAELQLSEIKEVNEAGRLVNDLLRDYRWERIFTITNITFNVSSTTAFANAIPLSVEYSRPYLDEYGLEGTFVFDFDFQANSFHYLSVQLVNELLNSYKNRKKRASLSESLGIDWTSLCEYLYGVEAIVDVLLWSTLEKGSVNASMLEMAASIQESVRQMSDELSSIDNITGGINQTAVTGLAPDLHISNLRDRVFTSREVSSITELLTEASSAPSTLVSKVAVYAFQQWQVQMETQLNSTVSDYGRKCVGFLDCLTTSIEIVKDILRVAQHSTADRLSERLLAAEEDILELALRDDLTIEEAISRLNQYISILDDATEFDYWCAGPPLARLSSYTDVVISEGDPLQLLCVVESKWNVNYEWQKDNQTISFSNNGELNIKSSEGPDSGMYHCIASNHIGSDQTPHVKVTVTTLPVLEEEENNPAYIYAESCSPVVLSCDVSSHPDPDIRWYFQLEGSDGYRQLINESATQLQYFKPSPLHTGQYYCEASNIAGAIQSEFSDVRILESSMTQFALPVIVRFNRGGSSRNKRAVVFSYVDTGIDPTQYVTLDGEDSEHSDKLRKIIEMELDLGSVTIMKPSFDNPSFPSSLTFLLGTRLIPIDDNHTIPLLDLFQNFTDGKNELERVIEKLNPLLPYLNYSLLVGSYDTAYGGVDTSTVISRCPTGQGLNDSNYMFCVACPPGEYQVSTTELVSGLVLYAFHTCLPCSDGQYQSNEGQTACIPCKPGFYQDSPGSPSCLTCPKGYYQPEEGQTGCTPCGPGSYVNSTAATTCTLCREGFYQPDEGQSSCIECSTGYTTSATGGTMCEPILTTAPEALERSIWVVAIAIGLLVATIFTIVLILIGVIYKHKRRKREEQYGMDVVHYEPDVFPEITFSEDPFGIQRMNDDDEEDVTATSNIYDSIDNYNVPIVPNGQCHYEVQQLPTLDEDEGGEENTEEEVRANYDTPLLTQQDEEEAAVPERYKELDSDTMMDKTDHWYQGTFANKDDDDYDIPLTLGSHFVKISNTEKSVAEEEDQNVNGEDNNVDEGDEWNVDTDDDQQPLIAYDYVIDQKAASDEDRQNVVGDEDDQTSIKDKDDQVSITDEDVTLI